MDDQPKILNTQRNMVVPCEVRMVEGKDRVLTFVASTEEVASDGDIVKATGWDLDTRYASNPQFLWSHARGALPIGRGVAWRIEDNPPRLEIDIEFAGPEQGHEFADQVYLMYLTGFMRAVSVGFMIRAYEKPDDDEKAELGLGTWGVVVTKAELVELSAVTVGADPAALVADGQVSHELKEAVMAARGFTPDDERGDLDEVIRGLPGEWITTDSRGVSTGTTWIETPVTDPVTRADLSGLAEEVASLREEVVGLREDLRAGVPVETPEETPEGSERDQDASDWWGLNNDIRKIVGGSPNG